MTILDFVGIITFALLSAGFYLIGPRMMIFNFFSLLVLCGFILSIVKLWPIPDAQFSELSAILLGFLLYWFGLQAVRTMLERSVSLNILRSYATGTPIQTIKGNIEGRLGDARRHKLLQKNGLTYHLTGFGSLIAAAVTLLYRVLRINE